MWIQNFRDSKLYERSTDLRKVVYKFLSSSVTLKEYEINELRKYVSKIPIKIASGFGQLNIKIQFKRINEAKSHLKKLIDKLKKLLAEDKVDKSEVQFIISYSDQVLALMNNYFGRMRKLI